MIDFIRNHCDAARAGKVQNCTLFSLADHPTCRVARAADKDRLGARVTRIEQLIQIKRPCRWKGNAIQNLFLFGVRNSRFVQDIKKAIENAATKSSSAA